MKSLGAKWSPEEVKTGRAGVRRMRHATYADLCKVLTTELILAVAHAFWFADEDAPCSYEIALYIDIQPRGTILAALSVWPCEKIF